MMRGYRRLAAVLLSAMLVLTLVPAGAFAELHDTAYLQAFIVNDPLNGDNGMETSPAAPLIYGPINIAMDVDGNAIEAVDEQDLFYANGYYYLIGQSFAEGTFNYAPGVPYTETLASNLPTFYRWSGLVTYRSEDLENWTLVSRFYPQEPETGRHILVKKPRIVYSEATGKYVLWFLNRTAAQGEAPIEIMTADSPEGPWSTPQAPTVPEGVAYSELTHDYQIKVDPKTGIGWYTQAQSNTKLYKMTPEMTGIEQDYSFEMSGSGNFGTNTIAGGMGFFHYGDWWYILGTNRCGNCIGTSISYVMAKSPEGPWLSPDTLSDEQPLVASQISDDGLLSQTHGAVDFPDGKGGWVPMIYGTHYRSSATGATQNELIWNNAGDNSLALSGQWWFTLEFDEDGRIKPLEAKEYYEIPLAKTVDSEHVTAYQADLSVTRARSIRQDWTVEPGTVVACVLPSVFQQTPDESAVADKWVEQDPLVNAPLKAELTLPNGTVYSWVIDARTIAWAPRQIALNLPEAYTEGGKLSLVLSTGATNGGYGVALGIGAEDAVYAHVENQGQEQVITEYPGQMIYLRTSDTAVAAPEITVQPASVTVKEGTRVGFLVQADGIGVGYQWYHDGMIVMPHGVTPGTRNESSSAALRLSAVTMEDAGEYVAEAINAAGTVRSQTVTLTVIPAD